jgi:hypothetical protein
MALSFWLLVPVDGLLGEASMCPPRTIVQKVCRRCERFLGAPPSMAVRSLPWYD